MRLDEIHMHDHSICLRADPCLNLLHKDLWLYTAMVSQWRRHPLPVREAGVKSLQSHTCDFEMGAVVAIAPGLWPLGVSAWSCWPGVNMLWTSELARSGMQLVFRCVMTWHCLYRFVCGILFTGCWDEMQPSINQAYEIYHVADTSTITSFASPQILALGIFDCGTQLRSVQHVHSSLTKLDERHIKATVCNVIPNFITFICKFCELTSFSLGLVALIESRFIQWIFVVNVMSILKTNKETNKQKEQMLKLAVFDMLRWLLHSYLPHIFSHHKDLSWIMQLYNRMTADVQVFF